MLFSLVMFNTLQYTIMDTVLYEQGRSQNNFEVQAQTVSARSLGSFKATCGSRAEPCRGSRGLSPRPARIIQRKG